MDDAAHHAAVVNKLLAARIPRQIWLDQSKLRIREPGPIPIHPRFQPQAVKDTEPEVPAIFGVRSLKRLISP